ncbi:bacterial luciferase-like protein [Stipitochalara longipes BDJ]|nr:bacterial luciferase-like protein [Stipitochalara longipes BDJ]
MAPIKQIHFDFFDMCCTGSHMGIGEWKDPNDNSRTKDSIEYYLWLAKLAEKGKITSIFFADTYAVHDTYEWKADASFRGGHAAGQLDPVVMVSAMASVTKSASFGLTGSTTYIPPYLLARTWRTMDHMTKGRVAWNIVTSYSNNAGKAMDQDKRTPVLFQAGSSKAGSIFAARHAGAIFCGGGKPSHLTETIKQMRVMAIKEGRGPYDVKFFPQITPILGRTLEEAQAKYDHAKSFADWEGGDSYPLDEPLSFEGKRTDNSVHTMIEAVQRVMTPGMTPRQLGAEFAFCGFACMPVGTPDMVADVADQIEEWITVADIDGFNVAYLSNPGPYGDFVELLVPVLQNRGIMQKDYAVPGGTFRENLRRQPGQSLLPSNHHAAKYRYNCLPEAWNTW